ncbi:sugar ABC transporter substrate-binding protein [Candidatus Pacearchaeota archaeon]|nr:sugar ABC transporter substrate-binding protein [Candidatus Pacearchaeota archaeon]
MKKFLILILALVLTTIFMAVAFAGGKKEAAPAEYKISWFAPIPHPYFESVKGGIESWEEDNGIEVKKVLGQEWTQENENENVEALAAQGYEAFFIYPTDPTAANGLYEELVDRGIYVVNFGAKTTEPTPASFYVGTDIRQAAFDGAEKLCELLNYKGNILNVLEVIADSNTILRKDAIEEVAAKYPDIHIIREIADMQTVEESMEKIQNALSAQVEEIDGIICTGFTTTIAATSILSEFHDTHDRYIHFVGIDDDPTVLDAIKKGLIDTTVAQNPWGTGYVSAELCKRLLDGWTPKTGGYAVYAGHVLVTKDNVDAYFDELVDLTMDIVDSIEKNNMSPPK